MVTARPNFLSADQKKVFTQLIQDNPINFDSTINQLKTDFPNDLGNIFPTSDLELDSLSDLDFDKLTSRVENYKQIFKSEVSTISLTTGDLMIIPDPDQNRFFEKVDAAMKNYFKMASKAQNFNLDLSGELSKLTKMVGNFSKSFIGKISNSLQSNLVSFISGGMSKLASQIFSANPIAKIALSKVTAFQTSLINPVNKLFKGLECLTSKVGQAMSGVISDMLTGMTKNMLNAPTCATQQFIGALTNKIADSMDSVVSPLLSPIQGILSPIGASFNVKDKILGGINFMSKVGGLFKCEPPKKQTSSVKYVIDGLLKKDLLPKEHQSLLDGAMNSAATTNSLLQKAESGLSNFEKAYGKWSIFGSPIDSGGAHESAFTGGNCDTGNTFACGPATVDIFGGDGNGAKGEVILGNFMTKFDKDDIYGSFKKTASIIGVNITDPGRGFTEPPLVTFNDKCNQGYGAYGKAIIDTNSKSPTYGQVKSIVILSQGENYPIDSNPVTVNGQFPEVYIDDIIIEDPGSDYAETDTITDDIRPIVRNGQIVAIEIIEQLPYDVLPKLTVKSETGYGAVIRPIVSTNKSQPDPLPDADIPTIAQGGKVEVDGSLPITNITGTRVGTRGSRVERVFKVVQCVGTYPEETIKPVTVLKPIISDVQKLEDTTPTADPVLEPESEAMIETETETETTQTTTQSSTTSSTPASTPPPTPPSSPPSGGGGGGYGY